jgi:ferric-dicitrate binding protein FerR (iron transport regulator)
MTTSKALEFVIRFVKRDHTESEFVEFIQWVDHATLNDFNLIAHEYGNFKKNHAELKFPDEEWFAIISRKMTQLQEEKESIISRFFFLRRYKLFPVVMGALMIILFSTAIYYSYLLKHGPSLNDSHQISEVLTNVFKTTRGELQQIVLPDGSKVWLDACSTLRLTGKENRHYELSGEAYFEVAPNPDKPFTVRVRDAMIQVLGTRFNVKGYEADSSTRVSLIEGSVKLAKGDQSLLLQPGEQAFIDYSGSGTTAQMQLIRGANIQGDMAWKEGNLEFNHESLHAVLEELSRHYNIEIIYPPSHDMKDRYFTGRFSHKQSLGEILQLLGNFETVKLDLKDRKVTVRI